MKKTSKSIHVTFRLTKEEYAPFEKVMSELELSKSAFFRLLTLNNINHYQPNQKQKPDYRKCLHYLNKTSNNMNQIAYRLNIDHQKGIITSSLYKNILNILIEIKDSLNRVVK